MARVKSKLYTNGEIEKYFTEEDVIPEGFVLSQVIYINNGEENKRWIKGKELPEGFVVGRLPLSRNWTEQQHKHLSEETRNKISIAKKGNQCGEKNPFYGKHHTKETKQLLSSLKIGVALINKGVRLTEEQLVEKNKKIIEKWGSLQAFYDVCLSRTKETKTERYGDPNYNNRKNQLKLLFLIMGLIIIV